MRRRRPSLLGTMARTAVVAGTATAVSGSVQRNQAQAAAAQQQAAAAQQQAVVDAAAAQAAAQLAAQQAPPPPAPPAAPPPPPAAPAADPGARIQQLKDLAELRAAGVLDDAEFEAEKARILAS